MSEVTHISEQTLIADIERRLNEQFPDLMPDLVDAAVRTEHARFLSSPIRNFVPLLVEKNVRQHLTDTIRHQ